MCCFCSAITGVVERSFSYRPFAGMHGQPNGRGGRPFELSVQAKRKRPPVQRWRTERKLLGERTLKLKTKNEKPHQFFFLATTQRLLEDSLQDTVRRGLVELGWGVASMGNRHDKSEVPKLEGRERATATTGPKVSEAIATKASRQSRQEKPGLTPPGPPDGHKRRASTPLLWPCIGPVAAHGASSRFRASPTHTSQWLLGD